jgi:hypothetical protein
VPQLTRDAMVETVAVSEGDKSGTTTVRIVVRSGCSGRSALERAIDCEDCIGVRHCCGRDQKTCPWHTVGRTAAVVVGVLHLFNRVIYGVVLCETPDETGRVCRSTMCSTRCRTRLPTSLLDKA